jgi:hypothetical protein
LERSDVIASVRGSKCSVSCTTASPARSSASWRAISARIPFSMKRKEFMFLSSVFVPSSRVPTGRSEMLASQRNEPSSMFTSLTPRRRSVVRSSRSQSPAASAERRSGSDTISASGVPPRLKSTTLDAEPWILPLPPAWTSLAASSSRCTRWIRTSPRCPPRHRGSSYWLIW